MHKSFYATAVVVLIGWVATTSARQTGIQSLTLSSARVDAGASVSATATGSGPCGAVHIDWGDGIAITYATETLPVTQTHVYKYGGTFNLRALGMGGCSGDVRARIEVTGPPAPPPPPPALTRIVLASTTIEPRVPVAITVEGDAQCRAVVDFGDGNTQEIRETLPAALRHTYTMPGRYTISATPRDPCIGRHTATIDVAAPDAQQITGISVDLPRGTAPSVRAITVQGSGRCAYLLDYGDGNQERRQGSLPDVVRHNYPAAGRYTVTAAAEPPCRGRLQWDFTVEGSRPPSEPDGQISRVSARPQVIVVGSPVTIHVAGTGTCRFVVDFSDGVDRTVTERLPYRVTHRYSRPGEYTVVVWAEAPCVGKGDAPVRVRRR